MTDNKKEESTVKSSPETTTGSSIHVPTDNVSPGENPKTKEKTEIGADVSTVDPVGPHTLPGSSPRTRYTWDIFHIGNEREPVFTISLVERNSEHVSLRFWSVLSQNVKENSLDSYKPRLKSIEVLD